MTVANKKRNIYGAQSSTHTHTPYFMNYAIFFILLKQPRNTIHTYLPNTINNRLRIISLATTIKLHHFQFHVYASFFMQFRWKSSDVLVTKYCVLRVRINTQVAVCGFQRNIRKFSRQFNSTKKNNLIQQKKILCVCVRGLFFLFLAINGE